MGDKNKKVFMFGESNLINILNDHFNKSNDFKIIGKTNIENELKVLLSIEKNLIILLDIINNDMNDIVSMIEFIISKKNKVIVICNNVKEGFYFLSKGANEMIVRPDNSKDLEIKLFLVNINIKLNKVFKEYSINERILKNEIIKDIETIIAIGSSTGGTECILEILKDLPENIPPILVVQHMPPVFTKLYSQRLNKECKMTVWEAEDGDKLKNGLVLVAPGNKQMEIKKENGTYYVRCTDDENIFKHRPSVDILFNSIAERVEVNAIGIILTGMGKDGANGLLKMRQRGFLTIGQDKNSCIVYGMPKVAYEIGAVSIQCDIKDISKVIMENI